MPTATFGNRLLRWYDGHHRDLPWRRTRDPWAIWVSEVMLQQTRVEAVRAAFEQFVRRYPDAASFAAVDDDELMTAWRGLGYYRRARQLRAAAREVAERHGGCLPRDPDLLRLLPGVGAYTGGAIASIAFGLPVPAIDGNVERVAARHRALRDCVETAASRRFIAATVRRWLDPRRPGDFNQALMELGATVCTPKSPRCEQCPVATDCRARNAGIQARLPNRRAPRAAVAVSARVLVAPVPGGVLAFRIPAGESNAGQWELPGPGILCSVAPQQLAAATAARCGARLDVGPELLSVRHAITHHRIALFAHAGAVRARRRGKLCALPPDDPEVPWTTPSRKVFAQLRRAADPVEA